MITNVEIEKIKAPEIGLHDIIEQFIKEQGHGPQFLIEHIAEEKSLRWKIRRYISRVFPFSMCMETKRIELKEYYPPH